MIETALVLASGYIVGKAYKSNTTTSTGALQAEIVGIVFIVVAVCLHLA